MADWLGRDDSSGGMSALQGPGLGDIATKLQTISQTLSATYSLFQNLFPRSTGTFTLSAAATKTVTDANVTTSSFIALMPTNAAAGTLMGSTKSLYVTTAAGSFVVSTASGVAAAGTETFMYEVRNPL